MSDENTRLKERVRELEDELASKDAELAQMRLRLSTTNTRLENVIDRISHEVKLASKVQKLLSPVEMPQISGFEFSSKFLAGMKSGGDYFDIFEHEDRLRFGIVLSASSGYTMSALFLSVLMKISSKIEARKGLQPDEMIRAMAREVLPEMKADEKASVFYGIVDRRTFELKYCSIGSICGFVQTHGAEALSKIESAGPVLSKSFNTELQVKTLNLNPRDRVILCSDGITSASNPKGQIWGEPALREAIRAAPRQGVHELRNEVLLRCETFSEKDEPDRDQTILVLEVKDKVIKLAKN